MSLTVEGTDISCVTNEDGVFTLTDVPMGERSFNIIKEEFVETTVRIDIDKTQFQLDLVFPITNGLNYPAEIHTNITGYVYDALTGRPLINGIVKVFGSDIQTSTDTDGQYTLTDLPLGKIQLIAMALDHKAVSVYLTVEEGALITFISACLPRPEEKSPEALPTPIPENLYPVQIFHLGKTVFSARKVRLTADTPSSAFPPEAIPSP